MGNRIYLVGRVAPPSWWNNTINYQSVKEQLDNMSGDVEIYINTFGGSVYEGIDIYNLIKEYDKTKGKVTTIAMSKVMSIGTLIMLAGSTIKAHKNSTIMCHKAWTWVQGNADNLAKEKSILDGIDGILAEEYAIRNQKSIDENLKLMSDEMWYVGRKQLEESKFVDEIVDTLEYEQGSTDPLGDPIEAYANDAKEFRVKALEMDGTPDYEHVKSTLMACGANCNEQNNNGNSERPKESVNLKKDKGELSMTKEQLEKLQADYASSQSKVAELSKENERLEKEVKAEKDTKTAEISALKEGHTNELKAYKKVFGTVLATGKHFELDKEILQANMDKAVTELMANKNYTKSFVAFTVNELVLGNVESDGAVRNGGGEPQDNRDDGSDYWAKRKEKKGAK